MAKKIAKKAKAKAAASKVKVKAKLVKKPALKVVAKKRNGNGLPKVSTEDLDQAMGQGRQGARGREDPRLHARPVGPDLHPAAGMVRRRRDQGRAAGPGRHHARPAGRRAGRGQPLFHDAEPQQALDHAQFQEQGRHAGARAPGEDLRRAGRELRARRARSHGPHLGAHPRLEPAHDRRLGQGLRPRHLRGVQGLRERRAVRRRLGLDHRLPRRPPAGDRRADRRQRHRPAPGARHRLRAVSSATAPAAASGCCAPCRTACSTSAA